MNLPEVGGEPKQVRVTLSNGEVCDFEGYVDNIIIQPPNRGAGNLLDHGSVNMTIRQTGPIGMTKPLGSSHPWDVNRIVRTRTGWVPAGLSDSDVAVFPGPIIQPIAWTRPFVYGLAFLLLLWGCMAREKWIGWVM